MKVAALTTNNTLAAAVAMSVKHPAPFARCHQFLNRMPKTINAAIVSAAIATNSTAVSPMFMMKLPTKTCVYGFSSLRM